MLLKRVPKGEADERDNDQMTPLHWSASYGNAEHIKLLLKAASNVTLIDGQSMSSCFRPFFYIYFYIFYKEHLTICCIILSQGSC